MEDDFSLSLSLLSIQQKSYFSALICIITKDYHGSEKSNERTHTFHDDLGEYYKYTL